MDNPSLPITPIPEDGLKFFYGIIIWAEMPKGQKLKLKAWKKGTKGLSKLTCIKPNQGQPLTVPSQLAINTIYVPFRSSAKFVLTQIRNAFCHNGITYDETTSIYEISKTTKVHIAGKFSLDAMKEFVSIFFSAEEQQDNQE